METSFRTAKALVASLGIAGLSSGIVSAQQVPPAAPDAAHCDSIRDIPKNTQCHHDANIAYWQARRAAAEKRGVVLDQRIADADKGIADAEKRIVVAKAGAEAEAQLRVCINFLRVRRDAGVTLIRERLTRERACDYARELGLK